MMSMITIITMTINCFHFDDNVDNINNQLFNKILIIEMRKWFPTKIGQIIDNKLQTEIIHKMNDSFEKNW